MRSKVFDAYLIIFSIINLVLNFTKKEIQIEESYFFNSLQIILTGVIMLQQNELKNILKSGQLVFLYEQINSIPTQIVSVGIVLFGQSIIVNHQNFRKKSIVIWIIASQIIRLIIGWNSNEYFYIIQIASILMIGHYLYFLYKQSKYKNIEQLETPKDQEIICTQRHEQLERIIQFYDELPLGIVVFNNQYLVESINTTTKKYLNSIKENKDYNVEDQDYMQRLHNFIALAFLNNSQQYQEGENSITINEPIRNLIDNLCNQTSQETLFYTYKDIQTNKFVTVQLKCIKNSDSSANLSILLMIIDITLKTHSQELKQRIKFQTNMLNSFSHELRTPLNSSIQSLEMLKQHIDQKLQIEYVQPALNQNQLLLYQINDILDYAAIQNESFQYNYCRFNLSKMFQNIIKLYQGAFQQKEIKVILKLKVTNAHIFNDESRITQIIINLINNSIKFTPYKSKITIQCKQKDNILHQNIYKIKIKDTGYGISSERLKELNKEIQCFKDSSTSSYWVSINQIFLGLGLKICNYLCQGLVKFKNRNNLIIKSQASKYTHVSFYFQSFNQNSLTFTTINTAFTNLDSQSSVQEKIGQLSGNQIKLISSLVNVATCNCNNILIVDDIPFNITALKLLLNQFRLSADSAYNGKQAIEMVKERGLKNKCSHKTYNLIFMDIEMPIMNGFQATTNIKEGEFKTTPIIMCSAYDNIQIREQAKAACFNDILPKPIKHQTLEQLLQKYKCI